MSTRVKNDYMMIERNLAPTKVMVEVGGIKVTNYLTKVNGK